MQLQKQSEKDTEKYLCTRVDVMLQGIAYKFVSPQRRSVPDRLCCLPGGYHFFVEVKSEGVAPTKGQVREIKRLQDMEHPVWVVDTKEKVDLILDTVKRVTGIGILEVVEGRVPRGTPVKPKTGRIITL